MSDASVEKKIDQKAYEVRIPRNVYKLRVRDAEDTKTKESNNKMFKYVCELIPKTEGIPTVVRSSDGNNVVVDGLEFYHQCVITEKSLKFANAMRLGVGLKELTAEDIEGASAKECVGLEFFAECVGTEEIKKSEVDNQPLTCPFTGNVLKQLTREIKTIIPRPKN